jgi:solute carrier family 24 (sodium/potassium/calcium exchanger), member 6
MSKVDFCQYMDYEHESLINFHKLYYCDLNENGYLFAPIALLVFALAFYLLGSTSDEYLVESLQYISKRLNMSETLAGVTLLALGNGAPDVISCFTAASTP